MSISIPYQSTHVNNTLVSEREVIAYLIRLAGEATIPVDPTAIVNLYVALKSRPLVVLAGTAGSGKSEVIRRFARFLTSGDPLRCQMMNGHPWWAEKSGDVSFFVEAQTRFNATKLLAVIEEAWQPENSNRVFVACLTRISPAELAGFFSEAAFQHGLIRHLPGIHLAEPIPYPPNLFLVGTMNTFRFDWYEEDLLSQTTIMQWPEGTMHPTFEANPESVILDERGFLSSLIRSETAARRKLGHILGNEQQALHPLLLVEQLLNGHQVYLPGSVAAQALIYLANAWSKQGYGLFARSTPDNLVIALDLAIGHILLPRIGRLLQERATLCSQLREVMQRFPRSAAFLESLSWNST